MLIRLPSFLFVALFYETAQKTQSFLPDQRSTRLNEFKTLI